MERTGVKIDMEEGSSIFFIICAVVVILLCVILIAELSKKNRKKKRLENIEQEKIRDQRLEAILANEDAVQYDQKLKIRKETPYEIVYHTDQGQYQKKIYGIRLQLIVQNEFSTKKFLLDLENKLYLGRDSDNDLTLEGPMVSGKHCILVRQGERVLVQDLNSKNGTLLERKNKMYRVEGQLAQLQSHDRLYLGDTAIDLNILG